MKHLFILEWKRALTINRIVLCLFIIVVPTFFQLYHVKSGYVFYHPVEVHTEVVGGIIALIFPLLFISLYASSYFEERKEHFIFYVKPRVRLSTYLVSKGMVNAAITFVVAFLMVFISFVFLVYVEPSFQLIHYENGERGSVGTFNTFLSYGLLHYGLIYSSWVAINATLYSTAAYTLTFILKNQFLALSLPFLWYFIMNFLTGLLAHPEFSTVSTIFPFNLSEQLLWTIFLPFSIHIIIVGLLLFYVIVHFQECLYESA